MASACHGLWACPGVATSKELWGNVAMGERQLRTPARRAAAAAWLARRRPALRRARLDGWGAPGPDTVLAGLVGAPRLERLELVQWQLQPACAGAAASATAVTEPQGEGSPQQGGRTAGSSAAVPAGSTPGPAALDILPRLNGLSALSIECCGLRAAPPQLAALAPSLTALSLARNERLGWAPEAVPGGAQTTGPSALAPIVHLHSLRILDLSHTSLSALPSELVSLPGLEELRLAGNRLLGSAGHAAFHPLLSLPGLTRLDLGGCALVGGVPPQVGTLRTLAELRLSNNPELGSGGDGAFEPLAGLSSLKQLEMGNVGLERVPAQLAALPRLARLSVTGNWRLGRGVEGALGVLSALRALEVSWCHQVEEPAVRDARAVPGSHGPAFYP